MGKVVGYSFIKNTRSRRRAIDELKSLGIDEEDIFIDTKKSDRPEFNKMLSFLNPGDRIDVYAIDVLSYECYSQILEKGIDVIIYDFSGSVARISPCSTLVFDSANISFFMKSPVSKERQLSRFPSYLEKNKNSRKSYLEFSEAFKDIYFAYESYQIDAEMTLTFLEELCGISSLSLFYKIAKDFEKTLSYEFELQQYGIGYEKILREPKRCNRVPAEYFEIKDYASKLTGIINPEKRINEAMAQLGMVAGYDVFHRWELSANNVPRPKGTVKGNFSIIEFKRKYCLQ